MYVHEAQVRCDYRGDSTFFLACKGRNSERNRCDCYISGARDCTGSDIRNVSHHIIYKSDGYEYEVEFFLQDMRLPHHIGH